MNKVFPPDEYGRVCSSLVAIRSSEIDANSFSELLSVLGQCYEEGLKTKLHFEREKLPIPNVYDAAFYENSSSVRRKIDEIRSTGTGRKVEQVGRVLSDMSSIILAKDKIGALVDKGFDNAIEQIAEDKPIAKASLKLTKSVAKTVATSAAVAGTTTIAAAANLVSLGIALATFLPQAFYKANSALSLYDLLPIHGTDPNACTCQRRSGNGDPPCTLIAKHLIEQAEKGMSSFATGFFASKTPVVGAVVTEALNTGLTVAGQYYTEARTDHEKAFLKSKRQQAVHLWSAAQCYGSYDRQEAEKIVIGRVGKPGITVSDRGCPKAIAIIAALFGELSENSNYLRTLSAISAVNDGVSVIEMKL